MAPKRLRCFVVGCNNEHSSRHLLPLFVKGTHPPIYLHASIFARIIRDPASPTEEVSVSFLMNLCKSPFLIMCLLASFTMNAAKVYRLSESGSEERGGVSRAHLILKQHAKKQLAVDRADFDRVKTVLFYTTIENF